VRQPENLTPGLRSVVDVQDFFFLNKLAAVGLLDAFSHGGAKENVVHVLNHRTALHLNAEFAKRTGGFFRKVFREGHRYPRCSIQQHDLGFLWAYGSEIVLKCLSRDPANGACQFHAGRPGANDDECEPGQVPGAALHRIEIRSAASNA
jgi:hypothetical protein